MWKKFFPPLAWMRGYSLRYLRSDAFAGITLAAYGIPVSMAYASLAGLPVQYGIYGYLIGGVFYALFGTGKQLAIGPTSAISLIIGVTVSSMAGGDAARWAQIASLTALIMAGISLAAFLLRLNTIVNFISESILLGFKAGAALAIGMTQLPKLFGVHGGGKGFFESAGILIYQLHQTNPVVLVFGLSAIILLVLGEKLFPGKPVAIVLVIVSIALVSNTHLGHYGITVAGKMPAGLPGFGFPDLRMTDVDKIMPLAFACFLLAYIESVSAARTLADEGGYEIDTRQELLALTAANAATGLGHSYPVTGGLSQSAVNSKAGAKTPLALVFASLTIALCLLFLTGTIENLPNVLLASILVVAISSMIDIKGLRHLWKTSRMEFAVAIIAMAGVLVLGILKGVIFASVASIILLIRAVSMPHLAVLGRIPGTRRYSDVERHPDNEIIPGLLIIRLEASLLYFNIENVYQAILDEIAISGKALRVIVWDFSTSPYVDIAGARLIKKLYRDLAPRGISLKIAEAHAMVRDMLRAEGIEHLLGHISRKVSVDDLVKASFPDYRIN